MLSFVGRLVMLHGASSFFGFCRRDSHSEMDGTGTVAGLTAPTCVPTVRVFGWVLTDCPPLPAFPATFFVSVLRAPGFDMLLLLVRLARRRGRTTCPSTAAKQESRCPTVCGTRACSGASSLRASSQAAPRVCRASR